MNKLYTLFFLLVVQLAVVGQDTIWTTDGGIIPIKKYSIDSEYEEVNIIRTDGKNRTLSLDEAFCVRSSGKEFVLYTTDSLEGFSVGDMREFVIGAQAAKQNYNAWVFMGVGALVTTAGFVGFNLVDINTFFAPVVPAVFIATINYTPVREKLPGEYGISDNMRCQKSGFFSAAKKKQFLNSLYGSGIGVVLGITANVIIDSVIE